MKLGVICDGISRDLAHTVDVMDEFGLEYAELQYVGDTEVGDHSRKEIAEIKALLEDRFPFHAPIKLYPVGSEDYDLARSVIDVIYGRGIGRKWDGLRGVWRAFRASRG